MPSNVRAFIDRWKASGGSERANAIPFLNELCDLLGLPHPEPATDRTSRNDYTFDRDVRLATGTTGFIDLYKRGAFVLEAKQGTDAPQATEAERLGAKKAKRKSGTARRGTPTWQQAMARAKNQARRYARALPTEHGWPPFLLVCDVGYCLDLYADFSGQGKAYVQFPDAQRYRVFLGDLEEEAVRERLRAVWLDPHALDPARRSARVTRDLAERLARLASSLEGEGHDPGAVAQFLMRGLFTMFAEDAGLLPGRSFTGLLEDYRDSRETLPDALRHLWRTMDAGGFEPSLKARIPQFNGHLFAGAEALPLSAAQLDLLIEAAAAEWEEVEPAIFGTLLERALSPRERHKLGAHYTPRAYVERLVMPAVIEPLRREWEAAQAAAAQLLREAEGVAKARDRQKLEREALEALVAFHRRLCAVRVLDPACGSGNFLYVTLEHLKRLEGEVLTVLASYGGQQGLLGEEEGALDMTGGRTVTPAQLLGLEVNPRAAAIAEVVLWIGYLQWHLRTYGAERLQTPILRRYDNVRERDALLERANGEAKPAAWPEAEFIVGNPPFIGPAMMRKALGDDYTERLWRTYKGAVPESADFVMYWWHRAAEAVRTGAAERFGFITTNSLRQTFNRRVVARHLEAKAPLSLAYAVPDHPWVDSADGADVRIAMTVGVPGEEAGRLATVTSEAPGDLASEVTLEERQGRMHADLTLGADVAGAVPLEANADLSNRGFCLFGQGFIVKPEKAKALGLGWIDGLERHVRLYRNGRDLTQTPRGVMVIDLFGLEAEEVRRRYPEVYQHVYETVKPDRDKNRRKSRRENWWIFGEPNPKLRDQLAGLPRYVATVETSKHRFFQFLGAEVLPDNKLIAIATDDAYHLGVLSSRFHVAWALAQGSRLGVGNDPVYVKTRCFETFPFPAATDVQKEAIRLLAEDLDTHRKARLAQHAKLTMTDLYNVLEKLRAGEPLTEKEERVHEQGLMSVLRALHDDLDRAVADAYGWDTDLSDAEVLERLVALGHERAEEEARGRVRYLRPAYQNPEGTQAPELAVEAAAKKAAKQASTAPWPKTLQERMKAVQEAVTASDRPASAEEVAARFKRAPRKQVEEHLATLEALGLIQHTEDGRYAA